MLVLGGTQWVGREIAREALARGHEVVCLARGESGAVADGARLIRSDRSLPDAYAAVADDTWDAVVDVNWQPGMVRSAVDALAARTRHWTYVSSGSVYASHAAMGIDESAELVPPLESDTADIEGYGQAKVACEAACREMLGDRLLVARAGLIGGAGDHSDRTGAWVARAARDPDEPMLVPDALDQPCQVVDVGDLARWLVDCSEKGTTGTYNAVGPVEPLGEWIETSRAVAGHRGEVVAADPAWLTAQGVEEWSGPDSLTLWIADPGFAGFGARSNAAATAAGLSHRPRPDLIRDLLIWERQEGLDRDRKAGLSPRRERELLNAITGRR